MIWFTNLFPGAFVRGGEMYSCAGDIFSVFEIIVSRSSDELPLQLKRTRQSIRRKNRDPGIAIINICAYDDRNSLQLDGCVRMNYGIRADLIRFPLHDVQTYAIAQAPMTATRCAFITRQIIVARNQREIRQRITGINGQQRSETGAIER